MKLMLKSNLLDIVSNLNSTHSIVYSQLQIYEGESIMNRTFVLEHLLVQ